MRLLRPKLLSSHSRVFFESFLLVTWYLAPSFDHSVRWNAFPEEAVSRKDSTLKGRCTNLLSTSAVSWRRHGLKRWTGWHHQTRSMVMSLSRMRSDLSASTSDHQRLCVCRQRRSCVEHSPRILDFSTLSLNHFRTRHLLHPALSLLRVSSHRSAVSLHRKNPGKTLAAFVL